MVPIGAEIGSNIVIDLEALAVLSSLRLRLGIG